MRGFIHHRTPHFIGVALATIITGAGVTAVGLVQLTWNIFGEMAFNAPFSKVVAGLVIISLGYIHLELELIRTK